VKAPEKDERGGQTDGVNKEIWNKKSLQHITQCLILQENYQKNIFNYKDLCFLEWFFFVYLQLCLLFTFNHFIVKIHCVFGLIGKVQMYKLGLQFDFYEANAAAMGTF
jgi:hypothetical protein